MKKKEKLLILLTIDVYQLTWTKRDQNFPDRFSYHKNIIKTTRSFPLTQEKCYCQHNVLCLLRNYMFIGLKTIVLYTNAGYK